MSRNHAITDILSRWPSRQALADDLGLGVIVVHRWHQRQRIPAKYDSALLDCASKRNIPLNWRELMDARSPNDQHGHDGAAIQGADK